jgi:hypothetical protein
VWAWKNNPNGAFADWNARVSCEDYPGDDARHEPISAGNWLSLPARRDEQIIVRGRYEALKERQIAALEAGMLPPRGRSLGPAKDDIARTHSEAGHDTAQCVAP